LNTSVVIVNYNGAKFLRKNITSLENQTVPFTQIIVIDNNSDDDSISIVKEFPGIKLIEMQYNSGYAHGCNTCIYHCISDLILLINSDIYLDQNFNRHIIKKFLEDETISLLSPLILRYHGDLIDSAGQTSSWTLFPKEIGYNKNAKKTQIKEGPIFSVCGAATVLKKSELEKIKINNEYYDEDFFCFWEDFDLGWRAHLYGLKTYFYPSAIAYHFRSGTMKKNMFSRFSLSLSRPPEIKFHIIKNRYLTLIKNFRLRQNWWSIPLIFIKDFFWVGLLTLSSPKIIIKLFMSHKYLLKAIKKRKLIKKNE
jgi:GT2 family glycosyltransferase